MARRKPEEEVQAGIKHAIFIMKSTDSHAERVKDFIEFYKTFHLEDCPHCSKSVRPEFFEKFVALAEYINMPEFRFMERFFGFCMDVERITEEEEADNGR